MFSQFVFLKGIQTPPAAAQRTVPSPLVPPNAVVTKTMEVLQRNDWPEADAGVLSAFHLTTPAAEGQEAGAVRSWRAKEEWLTYPRFHAQLHVAYGKLLNCDSWRVVSPLVFPSTRHENRAVQAVEVSAKPRPSSATSATVPDTALRTYTFTFCLERQESGSCKDCWLISGVRIGNYAL